MNEVLDNDLYIHNFTGKVLKAMLHFDLGCVNQIVQKLSMTVSLTLLQNNQVLWLHLVIFPLLSCNCRLAAGLFCTNEECGVIS